jgi:alcohol dehydrogenase class IV
MDIQLLKEENEKLIQEIDNLKQKINELTEHLKKYTAPKRSKKFYEDHKEEIIKKVMEYQKNNKSNYKPSPEKIKEYNKKAYKKRKLKKLEEKNN